MRHSPKRDRRLHIILILAVGALLGWAGSQGGGPVLGVPLFAAAVAAAFAIQWAAFVPAYLLRSERFFDLVGSLTFLSVTWAVFFLAPERRERSWLLAGMVTLWALRLGSFLVARIRREGTDGRFDEIKKRFTTFLMVWTLQGLWVSVTAGAAWAALSAESGRPVDAAAAVGVVIWILGLTWETVADEQKRRFRQDPENRGRFIRSGLWRLSRHPNYFGEILVWVGVALVAAGALRGWATVTLISPIFVAVLLTRVSGIPLLERRGEERWGHEPEYRAYRARTPALIPRIPKTGEID